MKSFLHALALGILCILTFAPATSAIPQQDIPPIPISGGEIHPLLAINAAVRWRPLLLPFRNNLIHMPTSAQPLPAHRHSVTLPYAGIPLLAILASPSFSQDTKPACNDRDRESDIVAGDHNMSSENCSPVIEFTVGVSSFSTAATCRTGGSHFPAVIYKCKGDESDGNHCKARGAEVTYHSFTDGGCPGPMDLSILGNMSWDFWKDVPQELMAQMRCVKPKKTEKKDWSAVVVDCDNGNESSVEMVSGGNYLGTGGATFLYASGPQTWLGEEQNYFLHAYDFAQTLNPTLLPGTLGVVAEVHGSVPGFDVRAGVTVQHFDASGGPASHTFSGTVVGKMTSAGRFDVQRAIPTINGDGLAATANHRTTYDGHFLSDVEDTSYAGGMFSTDAANWDVGELCYSMIAESLFWWTFDPFELPSFEGIQFEEAATGVENQISVRLYQTGVAGPFVSLEYTIDVSGALPKPLTRTVLTSSGTPIALAKYADYRLLGGDIWRPMSITETLYYTGPDAGQPAIRVSFSAQKATPLTTEEADLVPAPFSDDQDFIIWQ